MMEIEELICCTVLWIVMILAVTYTLNMLMVYCFERCKKGKQLSFIKEQNKQIEALKNEKLQVRCIEDQLKEINKSLEELNPEKQKEKQEANIKYIIDKMKDKKKVDSDIYLKILVGLNKNTKDNTDA